MLIDSGAVCSCVCAYLEHYTRACLETAVQRLSTCLQVFAEVYKGPKMQCQMHGLLPGSKYAIRIKVSARTHATCSTEQTPLY